MVFFSFLSLLDDISLQDGALGVDLGGSVFTFVCGYGLLLKVTFSFIVIYSISSTDASFV